MGAKSKAGKRTLFLHRYVGVKITLSVKPCTSRNLGPQVWTFWQSLSYIAEKYKDRKLLWLNFDETSVAYAPQCPTGRIVSRKHWKINPHCTVRKEVQRAAYSYCATICNSTEVQAKLPHFLIANGSRMRQSVFRAFHALPATKLHVMRRKTAWVTAESLVFMVKALRKAVQPYVPEYKPILILDCACQHLPKGVLRAAKQCGFQVLFVPSCCTSLLQPLDCYAFGPFKQYLRSKYQELRQAEADGQAQEIAWLYHLGQAPRVFFSSRAWGKAFRGIGASRNISDLHPRLQEFMQAANFPLPVKPTREQVSAIFPKRRRMDYAYVSLFG